MPDAVVVGAGPNGLVAANLLADAGWSVEVLEAQAEPGGAVKSAELTEPGFVHDVFSAFYPLARSSPAIGALELERWGLRWRHGELVLAHPAADGSCAVLSRDLDRTAASLEGFAAGDGDAWRQLYAPWRRIGGPLLDAMVTPFPPALASGRLAAALGRDLLRLARLMTLPVRRLADEHFDGAGGRRLLAGNALHTDLTPESPPSGFFGWLLTCLGQNVGYPVAEGGAGRLTDALVARLASRGGSVRCSAEVVRIVVRGGRAAAVRTAQGDEISARRAVLADVSAPALYLRLLSRDDVPDRVLRAIETFQWDSGTFKVDWALDAPVPWSAEDARRAPVVHVADSVDDLTVYGSELARGLVPGRPLLVLGQYAGVDPTRCPPGKDVAWAYAHVPQRVCGDAGGGLTGAWTPDESEAFADRVEEQVEALAPGFRGLIRSRHVLAPPDFERLDANLVGGALGGGTTQLHQQLVFRPIPGLARPETHVRGLYLASASAHPGGGVHGAPGAAAATTALGRARMGRLAVGGFAVGAAAVAARRARR